MINSVFISLGKRIRSWMMSRVRCDGLRLNTPESAMFMVVGGKPVFKIITGKKTTVRTDKRIRKSGTSSVSFMKRNNKSVLKLLNN